MLNIAVQLNSAHSETLPMFIELFGENVTVFYQGSSGISVEAEISEAYGIECVKTYDEIVGIARSTEDHGTLVFNTSTEIDDEVSKKLLRHWKGKIAVYHHAMDIFSRANVVEFYAHPFVDRERSLMPVHGAYDRLQFDASDFGKMPFSRVVIPNWSRPTQLKTKDIATLGKLASSVDKNTMKVALIGVSKEIMEKAITLASAGRFPFEKHVRLSVKGIGELLAECNSYIMPLVHPTGRYATSGLSGAIPMAYNYRVPLIISAELAETYDLKVFVNESDFLDARPGAPISVGRSAIERERARIQSANALKFERALNIHALSFS